MQPCGTPAVLQYTTAALAGAALSETVASVEKAVKATAALTHFDLFNITSLLFQAALRLDRSVTAADADVHGPWRRAPTSHEDGGVAEARSRGCFSPQHLQI